jgi:hypothetical protein
MSPRRNLGIALTLVGAAIAVAVGVGIYLANRGAEPPAVVDGKKEAAPAATLPGPGTEAYREMVGAFYGGVAALSVDANENARPKLERAVELVPGEPAAWANLGLVRMRTNDQAGAARDLEQARTLAPEAGAVEGLIGLLLSRRGESAAAIAHYRKAVELAPEDLRAKYALAKEIDREAGLDPTPEAVAEPLRLMGEILAKQPDNLVVLFARLQLAAKRHDASAVADTIEQLGRFAPGWPAQVQQSYAAMKAAANDPKMGPLRMLSLENVLRRSPAYQKGLAAIDAPPGTVGIPIDHFLKLASPRPTPAPADEKLTFEAAPISDKAGEGWDALLAAPLTSEGKPAVLVANARELRSADGSGSPLGFPGGSAKPSPSGILALDFNSDFRVDLVLAGAGGLKLYRQKDDGGFVDVTAETKLDAALLSRPAYGAWAADVEMDGDLDVVLAAREGPATVLRNNRDGTFRPLNPFEGATDLRDFAWADLDRDGDPDAATLDAKGIVRVYFNERAGSFLLLPAVKGLDGTAALAIADLDGSGNLDLLALGADGVVRRAADRDEGRAWDVAEVTRGAPAGEGARLIVSDLDNNGAADLVVSGVGGSWIALGDDSGHFKPVAAPSGLRVFSVADLDGDGVLDLAGLDGQGRPTGGKGHGTKGYHWQIIRPRATKVEGDGRINSFGVGGEIQVRAGLLVQTQVIAGPAVHFGLGTYPKSDAARIIWPNGTNQGEFDIAANSEIVAGQRLKGSCPFLYAFDGQSVKFVTDALWRSPLGLRINAQDTAGSAQTEDWVKVRGDQLAAKGGKYDLRVTAELWETHYWDHFSLQVVDHPKGTEVFVDERFAREPPKLAVHATGPLMPLTYASDDRGVDVSAIVRERDGKFLDTFGRGQYQGVTRDHWVEVEVGDEMPRDRPLVLVAQGWIHPTDSSINVTLAQGSHEPRGLSLEVATSDGSWSVARPDLGFPAGKNKTILAPLDGVFREGAPRRLRLRTNLEIYWDRLAVAEARPYTPLETKRLAAASAELRHRGFSAMRQADASSPELPDYNALEGTSQRWRDLIGYYTRFGDVRELLERIDDRYVIANAGDELALTFDAPAGPVEGWTRDFVFIGDGWNKDGDYSTAFSKTVLPLPSHACPAYDTPLGELEDDPVYRAHPDDWARFHTRYVTPDAFRGGLNPRSAGASRPGAPGSEIHP